MKKAKIIKVSPLERPYTIEIDLDDIEAVQEEVGGYFEVIMPFDDPVVLICDDEGQLKGKTPNRALRDADGEVYDVVVGDFLIAGLLHDEFVWLTDELIDKYLEYYREPEVFVRKGNNVFLLKGESIEQIA